MKVLFHKYNLKTWIVFCVALIVACVVYNRLPDRIPVHFGMNGEANRYGGRLYIFLPAAVILCLQIVAEIFRRIDPKHRSYEMFESHYYTIIFLVSLLMILMEMATIAISFHMNWNVKTISTGGCGILMAFIGNIMPKFKHNYFVGIRTSWTLADENVWYLTHRFASKIWVVGGLVMIVGVILPVDIGHILFLVDLGVMVVVPVVASYVYYRKSRG
jgi:uncharacterized membrane protein